MTAVSANLTPVSFVVLFLHCWGDTKPQMITIDPGQNQQHLISKQRLLANEKIVEAIQKSRVQKKDPQTNDSQSKKDLSELVKDFPKSIDLDKTYENQMPLSENSKGNLSSIESILQTLKNNSGVRQNVTPSTSLLTVLRNIIITCLIVTGLLFALVLLMYIFASLCMKSRLREPPVNNTYNIYITEEMKKNSATIKEILSERREDTDRSESPNLQSIQSHGIREPENKGRLLVQNSNYNNRTIFSGDFIKGQLIPLNGLIVPSYRNQSRRSKDFISSSELSDSDYMQTIFLSKPNSKPLHGNSGLGLNKEYMEKKDPNNVCGSQQKPDNLSQSQHKLNNPDRKCQHIASPDSLNYAEETQSDIYPSSHTTENSVDSPKRSRSPLLRSASSLSRSSLSE
ncbi:uncharacterized protein LOC141491938 isoform X2 [Macrotis lagotis]|uniref:uncharacterized protein LOC141491938 isoform X2 n=1 Tax=Macrotis lagotis TaxID=92651 RepID=UPI003D681432